IYLISIVKYHLINNDTNWTQAQSYCRENHTDLVSGEHQLQDVELKKEMNKTKEKQLWIGLFRDTWTWSDGSIFSFRHWDHESFRDGKGPNKCVLLKTSGKWGTDQCHERKPFFCYKGEFFKDLLTQQLLSKCFVFFLIGTKCDLNNKSFDIYQNCYLILSFLFSFLCCSPIVLRIFFKVLCLFITDKLILIQQNKTWVEAFDYCREKHRDLVSITDVHQQRWVQQRAKNASSPFVWLGMRYTCTLGFWFWVSDETADYSNWESEEKTDDCDLSGAMETGGQYKWIKKMDSEKFNFICSDF
uniref:C-type lectin domain-containing protein n=1 Tax=Seriola lalandi dorsalis TaxID=1841481 RepID=A0A3B4XU89_SERLL